MGELTELQTRVQELEIKVAFQQDTIESLNTTVTEQWNAIDTLKKVLGRVTEQVADLEDAGGVDPGNVKPPHY